MSCTIWPRPGQLAAARPAAYTPSGRAWGLAGGPWVAGPLSNTECALLSSQHSPWPQWPRTPSGPPRALLTRKDGGGLGDAGQALSQQLWRQVVQVQVDVVLLGAHAAALRARQAGGRGP